MSVPVWELKRGERFTVKAMPRAVFEFDHMDGMYCFAREVTSGQILNWSGPVERVAGAA